MSDGVTIKLIVLHEAELRKAAALVKQAFVLHDAPERDAHALADAVYDALEACAIALNGVDADDSTLLMLAASQVKHMSDSGAA